ncbi:LmbU family transcriptional regulator [Nonomuraea sp. NPDC049709]|uniref:LmbU family transcriptional regulator n=1 Tax=Nonomuraea sp. NPDC049709 TaxID=3154736 RepID=UPI003438851B
MGVRAAGKRAATFLAKEKLTSMDSSFNNQPGNQDGLPRPAGSPNGIGPGRRPGRGPLGMDAGIQAGTVELRIPTGLTLESWGRIGRHLKRITDSSAWWLGDWLLYGERTFPDRYRMVIEETALDYQTLRNYAWVARKFPVSRRRDTLSLQHHAETASLPEQDQDDWLARAEKEKWSVKRLRRELRERRRLRGGGERNPAQVVIPLDSERAERWSQAAEAAELPLVDWIATTLDDAATDDAPDL